MDLKSIQHDFFRVLERFIYRSLETSGHRMERRIGYCTVENAIVLLLALLTIGASSADLDRGFG